MSRRTCTNRRINTNSKPKGHPEILCRVWVMVRAQASNPMPAPIAKIKFGPTARPSIDSLGAPQPKEGFSLRFQTIMRVRWHIPLLVCLLCFAISARAGNERPVPLRLGFFPNITHAQALYARATGLFEKNFPIQWTAFNAGPTAIEALFAGEIDAAFIGPGPTINGYVKSHGEKFVIIAGAASGGAALVVRGDSRIVADRDFGGKTVATPQLGNTQDISARTWFRQTGYRDTASGG